MEHGPATNWQTEKSQGFKTKLGIIMFAIYTPIYFAFVVICVVSPQLMSVDVGSLNVAIVYGFAIIILAVIQAVIYNYICSKKEKAENLESKEEAK